MKKKIVSKIKIGFQRNMCISFCLKYLGLFWRAHACHICRTLAAALSPIPPNAQQNSSLIKTPKNPDYIQYTDTKNFFSEQLLVSQHLSQIVDPISAKENEKTEINPCRRSKLRGCFINSPRKSRFPPQDLGSRPGNGLEV